jgi:hypothetical protein
MFLLFVQRIIRLCFAWGLPFIRKGELINIPNPEVDNFDVTTLYGVDICY